MNDRKGGRAQDKGTARKGDAARKGPGRPGRLLSPGSHRSVLADFPHTARHAGVSALSRFRHPDGNTLRRSDALACFQMSSPQRGLPLSPRGPGGPVPPLQRDDERLRLPAAPLAALRCLRLAIPPSRRMFAPLGRRRATEGSGELIIRFPSRRFRWRRRGLPGSWGTLRIIARALRPR